MRGVGLGGGGGERKKRKGKKKSRVSGDLPTVVQFNIRPITTRLGLIINDTIH